MKVISTNSKTVIPVKDDLLHGFFYGSVYPVIVGLFAILSYLTNQPIIGLAVFGIFACLILLLLDDLTPFLPLPLTVMFVFRDYEIFSEPITYVVFGLIAICIVAHFFIFPIKKITSGKLYLSLFYVSVALLIGGIFSPYFKDYTKGISSVLSTGAINLFAYFFLLNFIKPPKGFDVKRYFCYLLTVVGCVITVELNIHLYLLVDKVPGVISKNMGLTNVNAAAVLLLVAIPACWYLISRRKHIVLSFLALIFLYVGMYQTASDGCAGITLVSLPFFATFAILRARNFNKQVIIRVIYVLGISVAILLLLYFTRYDVREIINYVISELLNDTGRTPLYNDAIKQFLQYPLFGVGFGYNNPSVDWFELHAFAPFNFHSTLFHTMATTGVVGLAAYAYYYVQRFRIITAKNDSFNLFMFFSFTSFVMYGMIDTCEFTFFPALFITIFLTMVECINIKHVSNSLPLCEKCGL